MRHFFYEFPKNFVRCFTGTNILFHLLAIALTYIIVTTGFDWYYYEATRSPFLRIYFFPAAPIGGLVPILLPLILIMVGKVRRSPLILNTTYAVTQAAILASLTSSLYKAFTGRVHPHLLSSDPTAAILDISSQFQFGFLRGGIFWGWPSSHTTIAFAMAVTIFMLFPKNFKLRAGLLLYAFYIGISVSVTIHWFSEFVAGAIFGSIIGVVVGKSFLKRYQELSKTAP